MRLDVALPTATIPRTIMPVTRTPRTLMAAIVTAVDKTLIHTTQADMTTI
jgi:hypothetical protein